MTLPRGLRLLLVESLLMVVGGALAQVDAGDARMRVTTPGKTTEQLVRPGSVVTIGTTGGGGTPQVASDPRAADADVPVIVALRGASLVRRGVGSPRVARGDRAALIAEHGRVVGEILRLQGARGIGTSVIRHEFSLAFNGIAVSLSAQSRAALARHPDVRSIHPDGEVRMVLDTSVPFVGAPAFWASHGGYRGAGRVIAVVDTGVDYTHPDLGGCPAIGGACKVIGGYDFHDGDPDPRDENGHGTHVASIAAGDGPRPGVAPDASLLAYRVLGADGTGLDSDVMAGIEAAIDPNGDFDTSDHADVINLSLGGPGDADDPLGQAVDGATAAGVVVVAAAGNTGAYLSIGSPGVARTAITVGAVDESPALAGFSSRGPTSGSLDLKPEVSAPGVGICAAKASGTQLGPDCFDTTHVSLDGTSMATPHVAGGAALLRGIHPGLSPADIKSLVVNNAAALATSALAVGAGILDLVAAGAAETLVAPAALSFGRDDGAAAVWQTQRTVSVRNLGVGARSYTVTAESHGFALPPGTTVGFSPAAFTLAPGETIDVDVDLAVDNAQAADLTVAPYSYEGMIVVQSGPEAQRLPFIFLKSPVLRIHTNEVASLIAVFDPSNSGAGATIAPSGTVSSAFLPSGTYDVVVSFPGITGTYVVHEGVVVDQERDEFIDSTEAVHLVRLDGTDAMGSTMPSSAVRYYSILHDPTGAGILSVVQGDGDGQVVLRSSSVGSSYHVELAMLGQSNGESYLITKSAIGLSSDVTLGNTPDDLARGDVRYRLRPGESGTGGTNYLWVVFPSIGFGIGFGASVPNADRQIIYFTPTTDPHSPLFVQPTVGTTLGSHAGPIYRGGVTPGLIEAFNFMPNGVPVYRTTTGDLPLSLGPAWFFDRIFAFPDAVAAFPVAGQWLWTFHDQGGDGPDAPSQTVGWRLSSASGLVASGLAPQDGFNSPARFPFVPGLAPGPYMFETDPLSYSVGGVAATSHATATFDSSRSILGGDASPPYLSALTVRALGRLSDIASVAYPATLDLEVHDGDDETGLTVAAARVDAGTETAIPVTSLGGGAFTMTIPCTALGPVDLVLTATDAAGNTLRQWLTPALVCVEFSCETFGTEDADDDGTCDPDDVCTNLGRAHDFVAVPHAELVVSHLAPGGTPNDDAMTIRGTFELAPTDAFIDLLPDTEGARVALRNGEGATKVDIVLPAGLYDRQARRGWTLSRQRNRWTYRDRSPSPIGGITKLELCPAKHTFPNQPQGNLNVRLSGRRGSYPFTVTDLPVNVSIALGGANASFRGRCGESAFGVPDCGFDTSLGRLRCRR